MNEDTQPTINSVHFVFSFSMSDSLFRMVWSVTTTIFDELNVSSS